MNELRLPLQRLVGNEKAQAILEDDGFHQAIERLVAKECRRAVEDARENDALARDDEALARYWGVGLKR